MSSNRDDAEAVASVGPLQVELIGLPELDSLVEGAGEEERRAIVGGRNPSRRPYGLFVSVFNGFETGEFHLVSVVSVRALARRTITSQFSSVGKKRPMKRRRSMDSFLFFIFYFFHLINNYVMTKKYIIYT